MTYTNKDKLYALAVAAGAATKDGNLGKAVKQLNIIASLMTDDDRKDAAQICTELRKTEPTIPNVKNYISGYQMEMDGDFISEDEGIKVDTDNYTHEEVLFMLVALLGGNLRGVLMHEDKEQKEKCSRNVNQLLNLVGKLITEEDYRKACALAERERPEDPFQNFLSA